MKIVVLHPDVCVCAGNTRLMYMMADVFKALGHNVKVVGRHFKETRVKVHVKTTFGPSSFMVKQAMFKKHFDLQDFDKYHPVRYLTLDDIVLEGIPTSHPYLYFPKRVEKLLRKADIMFTDSEIYIRLAERLQGIEKKHIQYVHFPPEMLEPLEGHTPKALWCNSFFTQEHVKAFWGLDAEVVYPPLYCNSYDCSKGFDERPYDVVMFARLHPDKFAPVLPFLKDFKVAVVGSAYGYEKEMPQFVDLYKDATFIEAINVLAKSKVYVHSKGFGEYEKDKLSEPEHFGQTITEAMASGCVPIVPNAGGPPEIVGSNEAHGYLFSNVDELRAKINAVLQDREKWKERSRAAVNRAKDFDVSVIRQRVQTLLGQTFPVSV
jgi:glycosyltransferase involved in cell wall biosynthesis